MLRVHAAQLVRRSRRFALASFDTQRPDGEYMKTLLTAAMITALGSASALAADLARPYTKAIADPASNWSGFYAGVNAGYGVTSAPTTNNTLDTSGAAPAQILSSAADIASGGAVGGGQIGYNVMLAPTWLAGIEADFQGSGQNVTSHMLTGTPLPGASSDFQDVQGKLRWFGTVRGRVGYVANGGTLLYVTGGLAYGRIDLGMANDESNYAGGPSASTGSLSSTKTGWTAGAGIETQLWRNWTVKAEYLYLDLGSVAAAIPLATPGGGVPFGIHTGSVDLRDHVVRVGLNYHL
jgi:outer membrane immunogenic protein